MAHLLTPSTAAHHEAWKYVLFGLCLWIWAEDVGKDPTLPPQTPVVSKVRSVAQAPTLPKVRSQPLKPRTPVTGRLDVGLDSEAFRIAFTRQASVRLIPCLREWIPSPAQVLVTGTLERRGTLRDVLSLDPQMTLPPCAEEAIVGMNFSAVAAGMKVDATTVQWRIDW